MGLINRSKIGLDIGTTAVRIAEVIGPDSSGFVKVHRAAVVPLLDGAVEAGEIRRPAIVGEAINEAFRSSGIAKNGVVVGFHGRECAVGRMDVPTAAKSNERGLLLRSSGEDVSPTVPTSDSALSWNVVGERMVGRRPSVVLNVAAALRSAVSPYVNVCRLADIELRAIDLAAAALVRAVVRTQGDEDRSLSTVVDIGASSTTVATREAGNLRSVRVVGLGGNDITRSLAGGLGIDAEIAEEQKRHMRVSAHARTVDTSDLYIDTTTDGGPQTTAEDLLGRAVDRIVEEVARSVSFDAKSNARQLTQGIQLVGGTSRQPGLAEHVQATIGVPTTRATAWADIQLNSRTAKLFATRDDAELIEELTCAIGLAMWKVPQ